MVQIRYILYFVGITLLTWLLTQMEISAPGSLKLLIYAHGGDTLGTSEYSPVEIIQVAILLVCGALYAWVAKHCPSQRPIAIPFGGLAAIFVIRELDYFLDLYVADNFWQVVMAVIAALLIVYTYRNRRRFRIAWLRVWPSPGITLLFAGAEMIFIRALDWPRATMGSHSRRRLPTGSETCGRRADGNCWLLFLVHRHDRIHLPSTGDCPEEPQPVVAKRRERRRKKSGKY